MKRAKRLLSAACALTIAVSLMSGAGKTVSAAKASAAPSEAPVHYEFFRQITAAGYPDDEGVAKADIMKRLEAYGVKNVTYKLTIVGGGGDYETKLNLLIAGGKIPDFFSIIKTNTANQYADDGVIRPLDDLIKQAPNYTKNLRDIDVETLKYKGKLYMLPGGYRPEKSNSPNVNGMTARGDWLDKLNIKTPQTLNEFHNMLVAFTKKDPDGNGKDDTYGMGGAKSQKIFEGIFGAYGVVPEFWYEVNGAAVQGYVLPEAKEALKTLQDWYKEGIIDPDFIVMDINQTREKFVNSKIGMFPAQFTLCDIYNANNVALRKLVPTAKVVMLPAPKGPTGKRGWPDIMPGGEVSAISAKTKDVDRLMKIIDWVCTDEGALLTQFGIEGKHYTLDKEKNVINKLTESDSEIYKLGYGTPVRFSPIVDRRWMTELGLNAVEVASANVLPNLFWGNVPAMNDYPDIKKIVDEYYFKIVAGQFTIDKFEEFVTKFNAGGGKKIADQVTVELKKQGKIK